MAASVHLLTAEHRTFVAEKYLADTPPRELVEELKSKFGIVVQPSQLRQFISRSGLAKRKQVVDRKVVGLVSDAKVTAIAKARAALPGAHMAAWAEQTISVTDKAFSMAASSSKPRELASAVSAANTSVRLYRLMVGIDGPESGGPRAMKFNFNFANIQPTRAVQIQVAEQEATFAGHGHSGLQLCGGTVGSAPTLNSSD